MWTMMRKNLSSLYPDAKFWQNGWVTIKCPYCDKDDKKKSKKKHGHFNIFIKEGEVIRYKCFRASCDVGGVLMTRVAKDIGIKDGKLLAAIAKLALNSPYARIKEAGESYYLKVDNFDLEPCGYEAEKYFNDRTKLNVNELQYEVKAFSSLITFMKRNKNIVSSTKQIDYMMYQERKGHKYIYFLNYNNTLINVREINGDMKSKIPIFGDDKGNAKKHMPYILKQTEGEYISEAQVDYKRNQLFIAEGVFDIINLRYHYLKNQLGTFVSSDGFRYMESIVNEFIKYNYKSNVVVFSDKDVNPYVYKYKFINKKNFNRFHNFFIAYNENGHDYGEIRSDIKIKLNRLK